MRSFIGKLLDRLLKRKGAVFHWEIAEEIARRYPIFYHPTLKRMLLQRIGGSEDFIPIRAAEIAYAAKKLGLDPYEAYRSALIVLHVFKKIQPDLPADAWYERQSPLRSAIVNRWDIWNFRVQKIREASDVISRKLERVKKRILKEAKKAGVGVSFCGSASGRRRPHFLSDIDVNVYCSPSRLKPFYKKLLDIEIEEGVKCVPARTSLGKQESYRVMREVLERETGVPIPKRMEGSLKALKMLAKQRRRI